MAEVAALKDGETDLTEQARGPVAAVAAVPVALVKKLSRLRQDNR